MMESVPVFHPTWADMQDFEAYMTSVRRSCGGGASSAGLARIVPPREWLELTQQSSQLLPPRAAIRCPVSQVVEGAAGVYKVSSVVRQATVTAVRFRDEWCAEARAPHSTDPGDDDAVFDAFWRDIADAKTAATYGADTVGSLFPALLQVWNLNTLPGTLRVMGVPIVGVTHSFLYYGMWKALFAAHTEDMELYSINYLHHGAPKYWYAVPPRAAADFEALAADKFPLDAARCGQWLRHKAYVLSPQVLEAHRVPYCRAVQRPGEFMVTMPRAYHWGFNGGYNVAEAVNFALTDWIQYGREAKTCSCVRDAVWMDMEIFLFRYLAHARSTGLLPEPAAGAEWTFHCCCGLHVTAADPPYLWPVKPQFQCDMCDVWVHCDCNYEGHDKGLVELPDPALCWVCQAESKERQKKRKT